jgi:hypothetical protein
LIDRKSLIGKTFQVGQLQAEGVPFEVITVNVPQLQATGESPIKAAIKPKIRKIR